jgi:two-component system, OmpR family, sensor histidine kinase VicK
MNSSETGGESRGSLLPPENHDAEVAIAAASHYEEKTDVIYGKENVINWALRLLSSTNKTLDLCGDRYGPSIIVANEPIMQKYIELHNRGVRQRQITEITKENIIHCKKLMQFQELRHLDRLKGYLSIADGRTLSSHAFGLEGKALPHAVTTTVRIFVEQQKYFFETLWNKAIPATQRIKEIEKGAKREFVDTIRDPAEIQELGFNLMKRAEEEIIILFSTPNALSRQHKAGALELLKEAVLPPRNVKIRILIAADSNTEGMTTTMTNERILQLKEFGIDVRITRQQRQHQVNFLRNNNLAVMIVDQSFYFSVELNDGTKEEASEEKEDAIRLATYSNNETTVFAYMSIFENLWMGTQA